MGHDWSPFGQFGPFFFPTFPFSFPPFSGHWQVLHAKSWMLREFPWNAAVDGSPTRDYRALQGVEGGLHGVAGPAPLRLMLDGGNPSLECWITGSPRIVSGEKNSLRLSDPFNYFPAWEVGKRWKLIYHPEFSCVGLSHTAGMPALKSGNIITSIKKKKKEVT